MPRQQYYDSGDDESRETCPRQNISVASVFKQTKKCSRQTNKTLLHDVLLFFIRP